MSAYAWTARKSKWMPVPVVIIDGARAEVYGVEGQILPDGAVRIRKMTRRQIVNGARIERQLRIRDRPSTTAGRMTPDWEIYAGYDGEIYFRCLECSACIEAEGTPVWPECTLDGVIKLRAEHVCDPRAV